MRETVVEAHLKKQVAAAGGDTRKFVSPGRPGVPDQIVMWPRECIDFNSRRPHKTKTVAYIEFVETKAPGGKPEPHQAREHKRLRTMGCIVHVIDTKAKVDAYVKAHRS